MKKQDFKETYPELFEYIQSLPTVKDPTGHTYKCSDGVYRVRTGKILKCSICGKDVFRVPHKQYTDNGLYYCNECNAKHMLDVYDTKKRSIAMQKRAENLGEEKLKEISKKTHENTDKEVLKKAMSLARINMPQDKKDELYKKSFETRVKNGTFFRSHMEIDIEKHYNGKCVHKAMGDSINGKVLGKELDLYFPEYNVGIEIDDISHYECDNPNRNQKKYFYHYDKDKYFLDNFGIKILHLTTGSPNPKHFPGYENSSIFDIIDDFISGKYTGDLIMTDDPLYGDIKYFEKLN